MQVAIENERMLCAYVSMASRGEDVVITEAGQPVARIVAVPPEEEQARREAAERLIASYERGYDLGGNKINRDELYDRGL